MEFLRTLMGASGNTWRLGLFSVILCNKLGSMNLMMSKILGCLEVSYFIKQKFLFYLYVENVQNFLSCCF